MQVEAKPQVITRDKLYINGQWIVPSTSETSEVVNAATEEVMGRVARGGRAEVDQAVAAARAAFPAWSERPIAERAAFVEKIADGLQARQEEIATVIAQELGMPLRLAQIIQVGLPITDFRTTAEAAKNYPLEERIDHSLVVREPVGVVGAITPWNYPLHQIAIKVAPALAAGCTVILKPSEVAPLNAFLLAEIIDSVGLPPGVFNLVSGRGTVVGEALASHPDVDMISFTGSTSAGKRVSELAASTIKRVTLELGGKSANIILEDADLERAVTDGMGKCMLNSGQTCSALTRMLIPRSKLAEAEAIAAKAVQNFTPGHPLQKGTRLGPLVSEAQRESVREYIRKGQAEGAKLVAGGAEQPEGLDKGYFVRPTVFSNVRNDMTVAQEEIFGPVLVMIPYDSEDEAIRIANDTVYGLAGGVWSGDIEHAIRVAKRIRTGQVEINGAPYNPKAPFGGYKQSGNGREQGPHGLAEYFEVKAIQLPS
jgi:aldehyde dehydrogenase (NAD+)